VNNIRLIELEVAFCCTYTPSLLHSSYIISTTPTIPVQISLELCTTLASRIYPRFDMENAKLKAAILIISDTAYKDPATDKAGSVLEDAFASDGDDQWIVEEKQIVPDDVLSIQRHLMQWCDRDNCMDLIITTGGTGFTAKDNTPEAVIPLLHRQAPGLV
jgi:hypothetical protein